MVNVGIYDGDLLIVDKSIDPRNFSTVITNVNEELVVKTLIKEKFSYRSRKEIEVKGVGLINSYFVV